MPSTIPELIAAAAERKPQGTWLRADEGSLTFGDAAGPGTITDNVPGR